MRATPLIAFASRYIHTLSVGRLRSRSALERWQERKIARHIAAVRALSPFYRELWEGWSDTEWRQFPIIEKTEMMAHFDRLNTVGVRKEEAMEIALRAERTRDFRSAIGSVTIGLSSGTSGNRGLFLVSERERLAWAGSVVAKLLPGALLRGERIAFFLRADSKLYQSVRQGRLQFAFFDLLTPYGSHIERLNALRPTVLVGPPSLLRMLAASRRAGDLPIRPRKIISVAEVLDPLDRAFIEAAFGQRLHQVYQCTEGFLASTCAYGTIHVNEDIVHMDKEYVDKAHGKFVPIVTDFSRLAQPIIRYRLNDVLTEKKGRCPCGSPFMAIESIDGRCDDLFCVPAAGDSGRTIPLFPDFISRAIIASSDRIEEYEAVQLSPERMRVALRIDPASRPQAEEAVRAALDGLCRQAGCRPMAIEFAPYAQGPGDRKLRRVRRSWT
ncbi:MAG: adenylate cyclase [Paenibacillus dendritiformis]|uniref:F390 synthetase-related protein n=1 Tax=Paenibacillus dendritiformis TaxID=130049 RepID=UPI00143DFEAD|nr:F390 synthetase-related protein [Paenibacillus dendritiformis]MDU5144243.1 adenylate cyclase [Paenibacillus dendritiformis]NKI22463.1 adenylate cyclase [Paenibacillus dendritiformis]NRF97503.1 adenylate cyclase [Paenibacillus dendritiformis]